MELTMEIKNIKSIKKLEFKFPLEKGLYAITGENASGKSTLVACASSVFFNMPMNEYFGKPEGDASISFVLGDTSRKWVYENKRWTQYSSANRMALNGFFEGSVIFGNRFRDTNFDALRALDEITVSEVPIANDFVRKNLGVILHDNENFYDNLYEIEESIKQTKRLKGHPYFIKVGEKRLISQARMSTGENLLITILHSLYLVRKRRTSNNDGRPCIVFLDEIELALHASALRRLVFFLKNIADELDLSIFFSTHSLELIRDIKAQNIYYLERQIDDSIIITNPCYPAYATRNLYCDDGYGNDAVIFVEDDLAKCVIERILLEKELINNIRIKVLPTGGWTNTIVMAHDVISSRLLLSGTKVIVILDRDIKDKVPEFIHTHRQSKYIKPDFLPISSLEKYLKYNLIEKVDPELQKKLNNYIFQSRPLSSIIGKYSKENNIEEDKDGKRLYGYLIGELRSIRKEREDLVEIVVKYILENEPKTVDALAVFLAERIAE